MCQCLTLFAYDIMTVNIHLLLVLKFGSCLISRLGDASTDLAILVSVVQQVFDFWPLPY